MTPTSNERRLALMGILLQALHVLFGITAIIGVLIAHTSINNVKNPVYRSQIQWQIVTFWTALIMYAMAFAAILYHDIYPILLVPVIYVSYRIGTSIWYWYQGRSIERWL